MRAFELIPQYDGRKSFYRKAMIIKKDGIVYLKSYDTVVAQYDVMKKELKINGWYSATTARHINEFIRQWAPYFSVMTKKEMELKPIKTL